MTGLAALPLLLALHAAVSGTDDAGGASSLGARPDRALHASAPGLAESGTASILATDAELAPRWAALESEQGPDRLWYWGWAGFLGAVVVGETVVAASTSNEGARINAYVNIPASAAGMLAVLLRPPPAAFGLEEIRRMPEDTEAQRATKAEALRTLFRRAVDQERFFRSPLNHVIGLTVNAGLAALLYFGWKLGARALLTLAAGTVEWELQIFTRPTAALDLATTHGLEGRGLHVVPLPNGIALSGRF